ncbi:MAG TPA: hypothetical protein PK725_13360 [Rhodocyclaceae bacterium]|nr:hypothetical protein [Rhodocyclaceae bacterium]
MGNHAIGNAVGPQAEEAVRARRPGESALAILDRLCNPWRNTDAEWESADPANPACVHPEYDQYTDPHPKAALGMLMVEAFAPNGLADLPRYEPMFDADDPNEETATDAWWDEVYTPFKQRYNFW